MDRFDQWATDQIFRKKKLCTVFHPACFLMVKILNIVTNTNSVLVLSKRGTDWLRNYFKKSLDQTERQKQNIYMVYLAGNWFDIIK